VLLVVGFGVLATIHHDTPLVLVGTGMFLVGAGVGMSMQNLILAVQNTVPLRDVGAATSSVTFFRSLGGTIGVSVLGAVLAHRVTASITHQLAAAGLPASGGGDTSALNLTALPESIRTIVRSAYGDATGRIFLVSAIVGIVGVIAALLLRPAPLRTSLDQANTGSAGAEGAPAGAGSAGAEDLPAEEAASARAAARALAQRPGGGD